MKVYVIMGNDFPETVFASKEAAEAYCAERRQRDKELGVAGRVYWRAHEFEVQS